MIVLGVLAFVFLMSILRGVVFSQMWGWFVVPFGVQEIGIAWALGLSLMISFLTYQSDVTKEKGEWLEKALQAFFLPVCAWGFGWVYYQFM